MLRAYPQALVKQLNLPQHQRFTGSDIYAQFNSAAKFHFPGDPTPMAAGQSDFLFVVLHEMIHGLGFTSSWDDYVNQAPSALTPGISGASTREGFVFSGFVENAFDRFLVETATNAPVSARTAALNKIFSGPSTTFASLQAFTTAVQASDIFKTNAGEMFRLSTTAQSLAFVTAGKQKLSLETSLSPYQPGSSVSHADLKTFSDTRFRVDPGVSLADAVQKGEGGPLGPTLLGVLESLGYATKANPNPIFRVRSSANPTAAPGRRLTLAALVFVILAGSFLFSP
ncbi:MAG: hypothetical protein BJ554DRAFT_1571 [Olpidium bornovanus]|uniref:Uncharacterized protein n=1 Tax=Olpidium bornovanus TaxID=278681 RepID=A0A8H8DLU0_9FUNG|nr:MAG: hypothetical protein BJ554DRAFT_1571 [Olpidium bornovanus]